MKSFTLAVQNSKHSIHALDWAIKNVFTEGCEVHLVTVSTPAVQPALFFPAASIPSTMGYIEEFEAKSKEEATNVLTAFKKRIVEAFGDKVKIEMIMLAGNVGDEIVDYTERQPTDALIIGSRGLGTLKRHVLGSVSNFVMHHAHCPVILIKEQQ